MAGAGGRSPGTRLAATAVMLGAVLGLIFLGYTLRQPVLQARCPWQPRRSWLEACHCLNKSLWLAQYLPGLHAATACPAKAAPTTKTAYLCSAVLHTAGMPRRAFVCPPGFAFPHPNPRAVLQVYWAVYARMHPMRDVGEGKALPGLSEGKLDTGLHYKRTAIPLLHVWQISLLV